MFGLTLPHLILIPPPWDLLLAGLLPFFILAMLLPNDFMMPVNDDGDLSEDDRAGPKVRSADRSRKDFDRETGRWKKR